MSDETPAGNSGVIHSHDCPLQDGPLRPPGLVCLKEKCAAYSVSHLQPRKLSVLKGFPWKGKLVRGTVSALSAIQGLDTRGFLLPQRTRRERAWQASYLKNPSHSQEWMGKVLLSLDPTTTSLGDLGQACLPLSSSRRLPKQDKWPSSDIIPFKKPC